MFYKLYEIFWGMNGLAILDMSYIIILAAAVVVIANYITTKIKEVR